MQPDLNAVRSYLLALQDSICAGLAQADSGGKFQEDNWTRTEAERTHGLGGGGRSRIMADGAVFEKAGVGFSHVTGASLPASATASRPELANKPYHAMGVSLVIHPRNPYVPTVHMNVRFFMTDGNGDAAPSPRSGPDRGEGAAAPAIKNLRPATAGTNTGPAAAGNGAESRIQNSPWWFGGGFDLTPCYGFDEDCVHWHRTARAACEPFGAELHPKFKQWCDDYFFLKHRGEPRGIGGLFFDDFNALGFATSFKLQRSVGDAFLPAYLPIVEKRKHTRYGDRERQFQLYRRGRYVEFNLVYDRGTLFGLQSGGRTESILMSLPPLVSWRYDWKPEPNTPEARLSEHFLKPQDWASL